MNKNILTITGIIAIGFIAVLLTSGVKKSNSYHPEIAAIRDTIVTNKVQLYQESNRIEQEKAFTSPQSVSQLEQNYAREREHKYQEEQTKQEIVRQISQVSSNSRIITSSHSAAINAPVPAPTPQEQVNSTQLDKRSALQQNWSNYRPVEKVVNKRIYQCMIHKDQTIMSGQQVNIRTCEDITIGHTTIPRNVLITGISSMAGDRLQITVHNIRYNNQIFNINLSVFGTDGNPGIPLSTNTIGKEANDQIRREATNQIGDVVGSVGSTLAGGVGRTLGNLVKSVGTRSNSAKQKEITLYDRQIIYLQTN